MLQPTSMCFSWSVGSCQSLRPLLLGVRSRLVVRQTREIAKRRAGDPAESPPPSKKRKTESKGLATKSVSASPLLADAKVIDLTGLTPPKKNGAAVAGSPKDVVKSTPPPKKSTCPYTKDCHPGGPCRTCKAR